MVQVTTWNVIYMSPPKRLSPKVDPMPPEDLSPLLGLENEPDVIAIGLQNVKELDRWTKRLNDAIEQNRFYMLQEINNGINILIVYVHNNYKLTAKVIHWFEVPTRGSDGGLVVTMKLSGKRISFVAALLTPGTDADSLKRRIEVHNKIEKKRDDVKTKEDNIFWFGSLNFFMKTKFVKDMNKAKAERVLNQDVMGLLDKDELKAVQLAGELLPGYGEANITFQPTYWYTVTNSDDSFLMPAWTDRVLFHAGKKRLIVPLEYELLPKMRMGEHKPVGALFTVG